MEQLKNTVMRGGEKEEKPIGWTFWITTVGILTTIGSAVPVGYNIGVTNSLSSYIKDWCQETFLERFDISLTEESLDIIFAVIVSIFLIGGAIGSLGGAWVADRFGRKGSYFISGILLMIGSLLFYFCRPLKSIEMLLLGRLIVGLAAGLCTASLPMYLTEIAPLALRGALGTFCPIGLTAGIVIGQIFSLRYTFGTELHWHWALSAYIHLVVIGLFFVYYFPESPKYLYLVKDQPDEAKMELCRLFNNNMKIVNVELDEMKNYKLKNTKKSSAISVLKNPELFLPLVIVCAFTGGLQLSGINAIFYYSVPIFIKAGLSQTDAEWTNFAAGCLNLIMSFFGPFLMKNFNRRTLMMFSTSIDAVMLFTVVITLHFISENSWIPYVCIAAIFAYILFFQFGLGPIPYFIGSELFETESRPVAMAMGSLSSWLCNFIVGITFPTLQSIWGAFVFMPFSLTCVLLFFLTRYYLPETRGRDVSDVARSVSKGFRSKQI
ncbi:solute carrier family 2, facilitated glucose transporter member 3-like [Condylostylus longicornis]|uniref:solute carrier family 2, facilitated glucose transporter member 3-like n=1 Tax=Condylostylus longicornis TaxID=2530218 RepID=UPI00244E10B1|nr:solute carrier family 2, facilitated glucose transporter member 3-like [Condylostylus longicornis]